MDVVWLTEIDPKPEAGMFEVVGGKAAGLAALLNANERVPDGFCVTANAEITREGHIAARVSQRILEAYRRLGTGSVAVRSSATTEDLPDASFAGQQDTFLHVTGDHELLAAVEKCWASVYSERAVAYREANGIDEDSVRMAVVVQRMVDAETAGVLFTANPVTGSRSEMVADAARGVGTAVVDGSVSPDHYVLQEDRVITQAHGCLTSAQLNELRNAGERTRRIFGSPQDIEWAYGRDGRLWLLQSRAITALLPLPPDNGRPLPRAYISGSAAQGVLRPLTPMGMSLFQLMMASASRTYGIEVDRFDCPPGFVDVAGRMYMDVTAMLRSKLTRKSFPKQMAGWGSQFEDAMRRLTEDPRFAPNAIFPFRLRRAPRFILRILPIFRPILAGFVKDPAKIRANMYRTARAFERKTTVPANATTPRQRLEFIERALTGFMDSSFFALAAPLYAGIIASHLPKALLKGIASADEVDEVLRGMPHNVTTTMNLELWELAKNANTHRDLLINTPPSELAKLYLAGNLPEIGLEHFLAKYARRGPAEIDVGAVRWSEDPTPVFAVLAGYMRVSDPEQAPDRRFARAAVDAEAKISELRERGRRARPVRGRIAGRLMRRARALAGTREYPKFTTLHTLGQIRQQLKTVGAELTQHGLLEKADDVFFLKLAEVFEAVDGADHRELIVRRRTIYEREMRRHHLPDVLLSDGTDAVAAAGVRKGTAGELVGLAAAPGRATGIAKVVFDPAVATVEPGEILVAPSTDPGWTPLFLTASALVTETGAIISHGPTVAREYGIPAVIGISNATKVIRTGQRITVDGVTGTVDVDPGE